jgi:hypothetical protein
MPGPVPKRSDQRRRRNKPEGAQLARAKGAAVVAVPAADPAWHPVAVDWFESLKESGQSAFYEPSDWATARYVATAMSTNLKGERFSSMLFSSVMSAMTDLLTTEGARRRARVELERAEPEAEPASVAIMARYRDAG